MLDRILCLCIAAFPCLLFISANSLADDWKLTDADQRRCRPLVIKDQSWNIEVTVPRNAYYLSGWIYVDRKQWVSLASGAQSTPTQAAKYIRNIGDEVIAQEAGLVATKNQQGLYYFYLHFADKGESCVFFATDIPSEKECLFRIRCMKTARANLRPVPPTKIGNAALAGKPLSIAPRISRVWTDRDGQKRHATLIGFDNQQAVLKPVLGGNTSIHSARLDDESRMILFHARPLFAVNNALNLLAQNSDQPENVRMAAQSEATRILGEWNTTLRYRVIGIEEFIDRTAMTSRQRQYRLSLRPLFHFEVDGGRNREVEIAYLKECFVLADRFATGQYKVGEAIAEFQGTLHLERSNVTDTPHVQLRVDGVNIASLGLTSGPQVFMPDKNDAILTNLTQPIEEREVSNWVPLSHPKTIDKNNQQGLVARQKEMQKPVADLQERNGKRDTQTAHRANTTRKQVRQNENVVTIREGLYSVTGRGKTARVNCSGGQVIISGSNHEILITGACVKLTVSGTNNRIQMEQVETISIAGKDNFVSYSGDEPNIIGSTKNNLIEHN